MNRNRKWRKVLALAVSLCMVVTMLPASAFVESAYAAGPGWTYDSDAGTLTSNDGSIVLKNVTADGTELTIGKNGGEQLNPDETLKNIDLTSQITDNSGKIYYIVSLADEAFRFCSALEEVKLPEGVRSIGMLAFGTCNALKDVKLPDSIEVIGNNVFGACEKLENVNVPSSLTTLPKYMFGACKSLKEITIPEGVTEIGKRTFNECSSLATVEIPESVTSIGEEVFYNCSSLATVEIPDSVTSIGAGTFSGCSSLATVEIPESVTSIGAGTFSGCSSLTTIEIPDSVTTISDGAFGSCSSLTSVIIPESVTSIGAGTFSGCSSLTSVIIPEGVQLINDFTFSQCEKLESIEIPESVVTIGDAAFLYCSSLTTIEIPDSVTTIREEAFAGCSSLATVEIPESVTSIGAGTFSGCSSLTTIEIPDSVTEIGDYAFVGCSGLTEIEIPDSVTEIGIRAFYNCSNLTSIEIPDSVTSIGREAFANCNNLTSIEIPDSITEIGDYAFADCSGLTSVYVMNSNPPQLMQYFGDWPFYNCSNLESIFVPSGSVEEYKATEGWKEYSEKIKGLPVLTVENGNGSGEYAGGTVVTISADADNNEKHFVKWTASDESNVTFGNAGSRETTITMPHGDVTVTAVFENHEWTGWHSDGNSTHTRRCEKCDVTQTRSHDFQYGSCTVCGAADPDYVPPVVYPVITSIAHVADQDYTGSAITPALTVYDQDGEVITPNNYIVTYTDNVEPGVATVTVKGKAGVLGSATATFSIVKKEEPQPPQPEKPGKVEITDTSSDFGRIRIFFDRVDAIGDSTMRYQIQSQKVGSDVVKTQYATVGYSYATVRDLAYNAKYNIKIRAYYIDENGERIYGDWSEVKTVYANRLGTSNQVMYAAGITKLTAGKTSVSVNLKKVAFTKNPVKITYQIAYRKKGAAKFSYVYTTGTSKTIAGLAKNTNYQFKVRYYYKSLVDDKLVFSSYTALKTVKTAK